MKREEGKITRWDGVVFLSCSLGPYLANARRSSWIAENSAADTDSSSAAGSTPPPAAAAAAAAAAAVTCAAGADDGDVALAVPASASLAAGVVEEGSRMTPVSSSASRALVSPARPVWYRQQAAYATYRLGHV